MELVANAWAASSADDVFDAADADGDGALSRDELDAYLRAVGSRADVDQLLADLGARGEGRVSRAAWRAGVYKALPSMLELVPPPPDAVFDDLRADPTAPAARCTIPKTEERAITLRQLRRVCAHIKRRCVRERWTNNKGELLTPEQVTLYDANRYVIMPATERLRCAFVELVASGPQRPVWFVSHWWGEPVVLFLRCIETHAEDHGLDEDAPYWVCAYVRAWPCRTPTTHLYLLTCV